MNKKIIELVDKLISNLDPTPIIVNNDFPLRWESNIFIEDYDFSENLLDLNQEYECLNTKYLKSIGTAIVINKEDDGSYEFWDGIFIIETHSWCSRLNNNEDLPSFSLINEKFSTLNKLIAFLLKIYN